MVGKRLVDRIQIHNIGTEIPNIAQFRFNTGQVSAPKIQLVGPNSGLGVKLAAFRKLVPGLKFSRSRKMGFTSEPLNP